jgi:hypothetical protein
MTLDTLEKQVLFWNKAAIIVPIFFTFLLGLAYLLALFSTETLFFIACGLYTFTAIVWWWWTMKSIHLLVSVLKRTNLGITEVSLELRNIRKELSVDSRSDK